MRERPHLDKSKYLAGRQCLRRLWLTSFAPELADPPEAALEAILEVGAEIGRRAHRLFPAGVLVDVPAFDEAVVRTRALLADTAVPAIFEAAFEHDGVRIRVDILERLGASAWGLREVKSGTRLKDVHLDDVALQRYVVEGCGLRVPSVGVIHVNDTYVRGDGDVDWSRFFAHRDVTGDVEARLPHVGKLVREMHATLTLTGAPAIEPSEHCWTPYRCEFWAHCTREKPEDWVLHLPRLRATQLTALRAAGLERIRDLPENFPLRALQARIRDVLRSGCEFVSPALGGALVGLGPPADYLDFETMSAAIPPYPGSRPYERIPFQWSLHRVDAQGGVSHYEFLADGRMDPRRELTEALLDALRGPARPILVYSSFEAHVLGALARTFPDLARELDAVRAGVRDLFPVVANHVYHPGFRYSFSLKSVAPALLPGFGYDDLAGIADGSQASHQFARIAAGHCGRDEEARLRRALLAYCARDTLALVELHRALRERAALGRP